jgi:hypothetical protein
MRREDEKQTLWRKRTARLFFAWKNSKTYVATSATLNTTKND